MRGRFGLRQARRELIIPGLCPVASVEGSRGAHRKVEHVAGKRHIDLICRSPIRAHVPAVRQTPALYGAIGIAIPTTLEAVGLVARPALLLDLLEIGDLL